MYNTSLIQMFSKDPQMLVFTIPIFEPLPTQYYVKAISDRWIGCESICAISFQHLILPERHPPHTGTQSLYLDPLPTSHGLQYYMKAISDRWIGCEPMCAISFQHLILPERHPPHTGTQSLYLDPLPTSHDLQYYMKAISDRWIGCESMCAILFQYLILPERQSPHTGTQYLCLSSPFTCQSQHAILHESYL